MLLPKSNSVYIPCFKSVSPRVCLVKVPFLAFLGGPDMKTKMGVVIYMYLKHSPIILIPTIYGFMSNSQCSSVFVEIPFLAFLTLHRERKKCGQVGPSPCYSQSEVVYAYKVLDL